MGFSAIFFIPRRRDTSVSFFITSRVLKVVLMVSTVHEHGCVQSRHPGCSFWQKRCQPRKCLGGRFRGLGYFANHRSKNMAFFCALKPRTPSPVQQNSGKRQHSTGEIQTLLIRALWKYSTGVVKRIEVHFLINGSKAGNERSHVGECGRPWGENVIGAAEKPRLRFPKSHTKSIFVLLVYSGMKVGLVRRRCWKRERTCYFQQIQLLTWALKQQRVIVSNEVLRLADPFWKISFFPPLFWRVRPQGGSFPHHYMCGAEKERAEWSLYLHRSPGVHYPDDITHAQTALCGVFLLIELLNDVESFKTNSVFRVWWLNDMDFHHCGLLWDDGSSLCISVCVCERDVMDFQTTHT